GETGGAAQGQGAVVHRQGHLQGVVRCGGLVDVHVGHGDLVRPARVESLGPVLVQGGRGRGRVHRSVVHRVDGDGDRGRVGVEGRRGTVAGVRDLVGEGVRPVVVGGRRVVHRGRVGVGAPRGAGAVGDRAQGAVGGPRDDGEGQVAGLHV